MKAFVCALSVLIILSLAVTANAIYVQKQTIALTDEIEKLPAEIENANLTDIRKKWDKIEPIISYSICHKELEQIADALADLESHHSTGETKEYHAARERLLDLVRRLSESEGFSLKSIF